MNADDRLSLDPLGRIEGGDRIIQGRDVADVRAHSSVTRPLDNLTQLGAIGYDDEVNCQSVSGPRLGRAQGLDDELGVGDSLLGDRMSQYICRHVDGIERALLIERLQEVDGSPRIESRRRHIPCAERIGFQFELPAIGGLARGGDGLANDAGRLSTACAACQQGHAQDT